MTTMALLVAAALARDALGHGLVGYIQKQGGEEICTMRVTQGNADGNYGPLTNGGDACGTPPGTPKKVLAYSGDGSDLRETQAGSGPYWLNPRETDATCRLTPGDRVTAYVYISGNHGGVAKWEFRRLSDGEGAVSDGDFQAIPGAQFDYSPTGPPDTAKALGPHTESFSVPGQLQPGWHTLRWNWIAPGPVQFVHCVDVQMDGFGTPAAPAPTPPPAPRVPAPLPAPPPPSATPAPAPSPAPLVPAPLPAPSPPSGGACVPETDCSKNALCTVDFTAFCSALALANSCSGPYCKSGGSLLSSSAHVAAKRHGASAVDEPGRGLRASSPRRSRAAAQVALIQRSGAVASRVDLPAGGEEGEGEGEAGRDDPASGLSEPTAGL